MFAVCLFLNNMSTIARPIPTSAAAIVIIKIVKICPCIKVSAAWYQTYKVDIDRIQN